MTERGNTDSGLHPVDARNRAILETALDCIITMDAEGRVVEFNPAAERTFGYRRSEVIGEELAALIIPDALREAHRKGLAHYLATGEGPVFGRRVELSAMHADGTQFPVELAVTRIPTDDPPQFTAYLRDISDRVRTEQLRSVRLAVTQHLAQAPGVDEAVEGVLRSVCESLSWDIGLFWLADDGADALGCIAVWHRPEADLGEFATASRSRTFIRRVGLPGRVWSSGESSWVLDVPNDANFPRAPVAAKAGLHSAFACPIAVGDTTIGVAEFFTRRMGKPHADLLETMASIAGQVAQFVERRRVEEKLRSSERELSDFFENAAMGLHWVGPDGTILRANRAELEMLGYAPEEYVGHNIADFHADADVIGNILQRLQGKEHLQDYPARLRCKDGSIRDVMIHSSVLFSEGRFVHTRCFTRDVTDFKQAEKSLRQSEGRFRALMEQAPLSVQIFSPDGRTAWVNRAWIELWGLTLDQIADYRILEDPQLEAKGVLPYLRRAFAGESVAIPAIRYDPNETLPGQTRFDDPVRWVSAVAYPLKDETGNVLEVVLIHEDTTAERRADAALRESEEKLRLLADTIPQLAWMARPDGHIFWYNRRWYDYTGATAEQMEGWGWQSVHHPDVLPDVMERWKRSLDLGEPFEMVFPLKDASGQFRPFLTRVNPLRDAEGRIIYWFGTNTDVSEIKHMEEALRDTDRRKDEFLATLAHELRNPLAPLRNALQVLKMPQVDATTAQRSQEIMERQVNHLARLVDDLLDVSRVMGGKVELRSEPVELATVVSRAVEIAQPLIDVHGHHLEISVPQEPVRVKGDRDRLTQIVGNLLTNAAKYTEANGRIHLAVRRAGGDAVVEVQDDGIGISPDVLPHVFKLFMQADHAATRAQGGLGIGLTLVKNLVELHDGTVEARSEGLGRGSVFTIRLPISSLQPGQYEEPAHPKDVPPSSGHRVLVVDDNEDAASSLSMLLRLMGHDVRLAHDGASALEIAGNFRPALIFLDIGMPGMDGHEVARRVATIPGLERTLLVALTGWGQQEDRRRSAEAGFHHHLVKPLESTALEKLMANLEKTG